MLGIVDDDVFDEALKQQSNSKTPTRFIEQKVGRGNKAETPEIIREIVQEEGIKGGQNDELAKLFGISPSSVSAYKHSATSTASYNQPEPKLAAKNKSIRDIIKKRAGVKAALAINSISEEDIVNATVTEKANVARQMSAIFKDMEIDSSSGKNAPTQIAIFIPPMKSEADYDVIDVRS